jgi:hypothetical protein
MISRPKREKLKESRATASRSNAGKHVSLSPDVAWNQKRRTYADVIKGGVARSDNNA